MVKKIPIEIRATIQLFGEKFFIKKLRLLSSMHQPTSLKSLEFLNTFSFFQRMLRVFNDSKQLP